MNPFNVLINYLIANSRASFYNVKGNQEITNTALLTGMISENPLMSYLIIDNKAKIEGEKFSAALNSTVAPVTDITPGLPAPATPPVVTLPTGTASENLSNLQNVKNEINEIIKDLKEDISKISDGNNKLNEIITEKLNPGIDSLKKTNSEIIASIEEIKKRLQ